MIAYHGTSESSWNYIKRKGIRPRAKAKQSNWSHTIESNPDTVYLTDAYAMHFGLNAIRGNEDRFERVAIIEIDTDKLNQSLLVPDEDALEQVSRNQKNGDGLPPEWTMEQRTRHYREHTLAYAKAGLGFDWSMLMLGTGGYMGVIKPDSFLRVALIDIREAAELAWSYMDTQVSVMNYSILSPRWRQATKAIFGDVTASQAAQLPSLYSLPPIGPGIEILNLKKG